MQAHLHADLSIVSVFDVGFGLLSILPDLPIGILRIDIDPGKVWGTGAGLGDVVDEMIMFRTRHRPGRSRDHQPIGSCFELPEYLALLDSCPSQGVP